MEKALKQRILSNSGGFTLVELLVVVGIVGMLSGLAVPQYESMVVRSRQSEAKIKLGGIYVSLNSYLAVNGTYTACLSAAAFSVDSNGQSMYMVGFGPDPADDLDCGPTGGQACNLAEYLPPVACTGASFLLADKSSRGSLPLPADLDAATDISNSAYQAAAVGSIHPNGNLDIWTVDDVKLIIHQP